MSRHAARQGKSVSVKDLVKSKPSISAVVDSMLDNSPAKRVERIQEPTANIQKPPQQSHNLSRQVQTPTLLKKLNKVEEAKVDVASSHATLTKASVHADFNRKAQAHKNAKLGFTRMPRAIQSLIS